MGTAFLWFIGFMVPARLAGNVPIDVAPPTGALIGISVAAIAVLCLFVVGIILVAFFIIRAIKKNRVEKSLSDSEQK